MTYMVTREPFRQVHRDYSDFERLFEGVFGGSRSLTARAPEVDVREEKERYVLQADMPGLSEEEIEVRVENQVLTFGSRSSETGDGRQSSGRGTAETSAGQQSAPEEREEEGQYLLRERSRPAYSRSFSLPRDADPRAIEASYSGGVLTITIGKAEEAKPRNIQINPA